MHRFISRFARRKSVVNVSLDVLDDDDRVVDDDPDRQNEPEKRKVVQAETERAHRDERPDQRNRRRQERNERRAPTLQEQHDDQTDQNDRFEQRVLHRFDGGFNERRRVVRDDVVDTVRELFREFG